MFSLRASSPFGGHPPPIGQRSSVSKKKKKPDMFADSDVTKTRNGERATGNGERARGTGKGLHFPVSWARSPIPDPRSPF